MPRVAVVGSWSGDEHLISPLQHVAGRSLHLSVHNPGERLHADIVLMNDEEFARYANTADDPSVPVIVATRDPCSCTEFLDHGANAVIALPIDAAELTSAIYALVAPGRYLSRRVVAALLDQTDPESAMLPALSEREVGVLTRLAAGLSDAEIAEVLFLSSATVHTHILNLRRKLGARNRTHAVVLAIQRGIIPPISPRA